MSLISGFSLDKAGLLVTTWPIQNVIFRNLSFMVVRTWHLKRPFNLPMTLEYGLDMLTPWTFDIIITLQRCTSVLRYPVYSAYTYIPHTLLASPHTPLGFCVDHIHRLVSAFTILGGKVTKPVWFGQGGMVVSTCSREVLSPSPPAGRESWALPTVMAALISFICCCNMWNSLLRPMGLDLLLFPLRLFLPRGNHCRVFPNSQGVLSRPVEFQDPARKHRVYLKYISWIPILIGHMG